MIVDCVIVGGGLAGLCAAKRLIELGKEPVIIEAGGYPAHKVCGEFISPSSLAILERWGISPVPLYKVSLYTGSQMLEFKFPTPAGSLSHFTLDAYLADQIVKQGGAIFTHTKVQHLAPHETHTLTLSSGKTLRAKHLFIATGRVTQRERPQAKYLGIKAHFSGIKLDSTLQMFSFPGAYLGLVPIENQHANLACLVELKKFKQFSSTQHLMQSLIKAHPLLQQFLEPSHLLFDQWMEASISSFGLRSNPSWPRTYWIGDAASTIPPACGNGLSLSITSGCLAAEFAEQDNALGFKHAWKKLCSSQILYGKMLHSLFLHPFWGEKVLHLSRQFPALTQKIFTLTRH